MPQPLDDLARMLDTLQAGAALIDRQGRIHHANPRICALLHVPAGALDDTPVATLFPPGDSERRLATLLERFDTPSEREIALRRADDDTVRVLVAGRPAGDAPPLSDYRVITIHDVSGLMQAYDQITSLSDTVIQQALALKQANAELEARVQERTRELRDAWHESICMLAMASEGRDQDTGDHIRRIERICRAVAAAAGLPPHDVERIGSASLLHDIGKLHIPDAILKKPGPLTDVERAEMQLHTTRGEALLSTNPFFDTARLIARAHHENYDGTGYPDRRAARDIPLPARIVRVADVFDALTSPRVYKPAWPLERALDEIRRGSGHAFDPDLVDLFITLVDQGDIRPPQQDASDEAS